MSKNTISITIEQNILQQFKAKVGYGNVSPTIEQFMETYTTSDINKIDRKILTRQIKDLKETSNKTNSELIKKQELLKKLDLEEEEKRIQKEETEKQLLENAKRCFRCNEVIENIETLKDFKDFKLCNTCFLGLGSGELSELKKRAKEEQLNEGKDDEKKFKKYELQTL